MAKGTNINSGIRGQILASLPDARKDEYEHFECLATIKPEITLLKFRSPYDAKYPNRPYLQMECVCTGVKAKQGQLLPYEADKIELDPDESSQIQIDAEYEFSNDEICTLVKKGMYQRGFQCPEMFQEIEMNIPAPDVTLIVVKPQTQHDVPLYHIDFLENHIRFSKEMIEKPLAELFEERQVQDPSKEVVEEFETQVQRITEPEPEVVYDTFMDKSFLEPSSAEPESQSEEEKQAQPKQEEKQAQPEPQLNPAFLELLNEYSNKPEQEEKQAQPEPEPESEPEQPEQEDDDVSVEKIEKMVQLALNRGVERSQLARKISNALENTRPEPKKTQNLYGQTNYIVGTYPKTSNSSISSAQRNNNDLDGPDL